MQDKRAFEAWKVVSSLSVLSPDVTHQSRERGQGCEHVHDPENVDILREIGRFLQSNLKMFCYLLKACSREPETAILFWTALKSYLQFCLIINDSPVQQPFKWDFKRQFWATQRHQNGVTDLQVFTRAHAWTGMDQKMSRPMRKFWSIEQNPLIIPFWNVL